MDPAVTSVNAGQGLTGVTPCGPWLEGMAHTHPLLLATCTWGLKGGYSHEGKGTKDASASAGHFPGDLTALFLTHVSRPGGPALFTVRGAASSEQLASADTVLV